MAAGTTNEQNHRVACASALRPALWVVIGVCASCSGASAGAPREPQALRSSAGGPEPSAETAAVQREEDVARQSTPPPPDVFHRDSKYEVDFVAELFGSVPSRIDRQMLSRPLVAPTRGEGLWMAVDHHAPRRARGPRLAIDELLSEEVELAPGSHWLSAWKVADGRLTVQTHAFFVDVEPTRLPLAPGCIVTTPHLTVNGPSAAERVEFMAVPLMAGIDQVEYLATGRDYASRTVAPPAMTLAMQSPPSGDIELSIRCLGGNEELGVDAQIITVNGDAPDPEELP